MKNKKRILLVEDEPGMQLTVSDRLIGEGYDVDCSGDGLEGWKMAEKGNYDVILLDIMLPQKDGFEICRDLRASGIKTPVMMVSAKTQVIDRVFGLKMGADDYLIKPFDLMELTARIEALLRRNITEDSEPHEESFSFGPFLLNFMEKNFTKNGHKVGLSFQEYKLLEFLIKNRDKVLSREKLLDGVWGYDEIPSTRTVDVHIALLRQKIEENKANPRYITTVRKHGYKFTVN